MTEPVAGAAPTDPSEPQDGANLLTPTPAELRDELQALIFGDLHGPAGDDHEVLPGRQRVRDRYIVGMLAPRNTLATQPSRKENSQGVAGMTGASDDTGSDDTATPAVVDLFPSSMGMSFTTVLDPGLLRVEAAWGRYTKQATDDVTDDKTTEWRREPIRGAVEVEVVEGELGPYTMCEDFPDVRVRGRAVALDRGWLVTLFLVNEQAAPAVNKDSAWLFQATLAVEAADGNPVFCGRSDVLEDGGLPGEVDELALLDLQYRNLVEFAVGHGTATNARRGDDPALATRIETTFVPDYEVPATEAPHADDPGLDPAVAELLEQVVLDMKSLSECDGDALVAATSPLVDAYDLWLDAQEARLAVASDHLAAHVDAATTALDNARKASGRLRDGIALLAVVDGIETDTAEAFRFANHVMWQQRVHSVAADLRRIDPELDFAATLAEVDIPKNRSWRPFQLAFLLLNLPSLTVPTHSERSADEGLVDLLFFPTGGGKTEAYLGLTAFTLAIRRLQGVVAGRDGGAGGVAVLMRYTLRLLTAQQFERAAALMCACELRRRELFDGDERWGSEPFRLGMWVGANVTPNRTKDASLSIEDARTSGRRRSSSASPVQLVTCPWCGTRLDAGRDAVSDVDRWRTLLFCGDEMGRCEFTQVNSPGEGLPVVTVDEEIYRLLPAFIISTADKFAQLPWRGPLHLLFGRVSARCERHGYRSEDLDVLDSSRKEADTHHKTGALPAAKTVAVTPLRPPDLIIQDELHLISGPLGTLVGLYETAIDELASWAVDGQKVRPKVIASTATVRRADEQVHALFARRLAVFPPPALDVSDSFFAREVALDRRPGRRYVGLCTPGLRLKSAQVRVFASVLSASQRMYGRYGIAADPWMTLVGYFSALRELAGNRRLVDDEIKNGAWRGDRRGLGKRRIREVQELTSRVGAAEIRNVLDRLKQQFDPAKTEGAPPIDVLLATNMISVGVDVGRLGLMIAVGQPKTTAEYIQATSRVGRSDPGPGLVFTLYNWARPRDLSHYETFEHYHATFYRQVEALSVTPFAPRALDRGLSAVLVALARQGTDRKAWNPNAGAQLVDLDSPEVTEIIELIVSRAGKVTSNLDTADLVRAMLVDRIGRWKAEQTRAGASLGYDEDARKAIAPLLEPPGIDQWAWFTCPWSLRETEPTVNLIIDPYDASIVDPPPFVLGAGKRQHNDDLAEDEEVDDAVEVKI